MSGPPPYGRSYSPSYASPGEPPRNPDTRPLPPGWVEQYDYNYKTWFYVNTREDPPRPSWVHPTAPPAPRPSGYGPPLGPPPPDGNRGYSPRPYSPQGPSSGGYGGYDQPPRGYDQPPQGYDQPPRGYGPPSRGGYDDGYRPGPSYRPDNGYGGMPPDESRGFFGGGPSMQQAPVEVVQAAPPKKHKFGVGTAVAAGGAALVGGLLIGDLIEDHEDHEREEAFDQGFQDGAMDDRFDDGFGGGGW
ncbi:hypothetical protein POSPLADRAFT_1035036 [Postia placenta MAD-698-R-SB12]|uniref:WW domain-containing protein n=1 Tax=Postia placenta MAD-698-R-SB12 TaxID=670580 RepID=A0A1X6MW78_9APHY|nr:hypothetical protein POSPLADRAFT_1035036 [Postia placenta MAD-698-R-SB12]OSX60476.1 hypothetical protein POSPLADRAFT_1035036 [Postia placenta MAD-698-R-SB12]